MIHSLLLQVVNRLDAIEPKITAIEPNVLISIPPSSSLHDEQHFTCPTASNQLITSPAAASSQQVPSFPLQATSSTSEADIEASGNDNAVQLNSINRDWEAGYCLSKRKCFQY